ncbi:MAG TPA: globin [Symbiobacteriaceae bacterium]|nr:globin [Symbiobacteriaceae bacterium]
MEYQSLYELMGGAETIRRLVDAFYPKVQTDPDIGPLFPADITPVMEKQYLFLSQFFGGPALYNEKHGHPMLRQRHMPFPIDERRARAWLRCMAAALEEISLDEEVREQVFQRLSFTAAHMINTERQP